jgi:hypothetical protein
MIEGREEFTHRCSEYWPGKFSDGDNLGAPARRDRQLPDTTVSYQVTNLAAQLL